MAPERSRLKPSVSHVRRLPVLINGGEISCERWFWAPRAGVGIEIVRQAVERRHQVTALVRSASRLKSYEHAIQTIEGDLLDPNSLENALRNQEAVLSAFGPRLPIAKGERDLLTRFAAGLVPTMQGVNAVPGDRFNRISFQRHSATAGLSIRALIFSNCCQGCNRDGKHNYEQWSGLEHRPPASTERQAAYGQKSGGR